MNLHHHGDDELAPDLVDLAVNVRAGTPPEWLRAVLHQAVDASAAYPDARPARAAVAAAHGRDPSEVLLTAGAAGAVRPAPPTPAPPPPGPVPPPPPPPPAAARG